MRFVENTGGLWIAEQLRIAEAEIEQQKRNWEADRLAALQKEQEQEDAQRDEDELLTYSRADAKNQVNNRSKYVHRELKHPGRPAKQSPAPAKRGAVMARATNNNSRVGNSSCSSTTKHRQPRELPMSTPAKRIVPKRGQAQINSNSASKSLSDKRAKLLIASPSSPATVHSPASLATNKLERSVKRRVQTAPQLPEAKTRQTKTSDVNRRTLRTRRHNDDDDESSSSDDGSDEKARNDEEDDSECSLDAMYDSIDDDQSNEGVEQSVSSTGTDDEAIRDDGNEDDEDGDEEDDEEEENDDDVEDESDSESDEEFLINKIPTSATKALKVTTENNGHDASGGGALSPTSTIRRRTSNHLDINSPRTRSRGTVKLDLWTLDVSPILPSSKALSKRRPVVKSTTGAAETSAPIDIIDLLDSDLSDAKSTMDAPSGPVTVAIKRNGNNSTKTTPPVRGPTISKLISMSPRTMRALSPKVVLVKDDLARMMETGVGSDSAVTASGSGGPDIARRRTRGVSVAKTTTPDNGMA